MQKVGPTTKLSDSVSISDSCHLHSHVTGKLRVPWKSPYPYAHPHILIRILLLISSSSHLLSINKPSKGASVNVIGIGGFPILSHFLSFSPLFLTPILSF